MFIHGTRTEFSILNALSSHRAGMNRSIERLSTGNRINRAADDPSGLISAENLRAALTLLDADLSTLGRVDNIAMTADSILGEVVSLLTNAEGLQHANTNDSGLTEDEKAANDDSIRSIIETVNGIFEDSTFLDQKLFDGSLHLETPGGKALRIGNLAFSMWGETAEDRLDEIQSFRKQMSTLRGDVGAFGRHSVRSEQRSIQIAVENLSSAESLIRDADFAKETADLVRFQTMLEASIMSLQFMRAHANDVLALLNHTFQ